MPRHQLHFKPALWFWCILVLSLCCGTHGPAEGDSAAREVSLGDVQFKATHNSYRLPDLPSVQIIHYNVWEIELDFGMISDPPEFVVGHDGPEPKGGLRSLRDWILDIKKATSSVAHPIILKLEAKTKDRSGPFKKRHWLPVNKWGEWQMRLRDHLITWIGEENWITRRKFENRYSSEWPSIGELAGKFIITIQDNNDNRDIDFQTVWFFVGEVPGLVAAWPDDHPIHGPTEFGRSVKCGANRLIMDDEYRESWSNIFVHPPVPCYVCPSCSGPQWGTMAYPFHSVAHAMNAHWTYSGLPLSGQAVMPSDNCSVPSTEDRRISIHPGSMIEPSPEGKTACMVALSIWDVKHAQTDDSIWYEIEGGKGRTAEVLFGRPENNPARAGFSIARYDSVALGEPRSITIRISGDDDIAIDMIVITCSVSGRYIGDMIGWIGDDHVNPVTIPLSPCDQK